ncbi:hypothetical protein KY290_000917 [Solanum tuberosum]|uniref:Uncharacterized protein n=1 Tax=Solanum tuberosum TaxID=4113 RepID=A0ABQ7WMN9_SOLTU|nr:hypothetical protein KY290_000917 [Solanum tuberosum]
MVGNGDGKSLELSKDPIVFHLQILKLRRRKELRSNRFQIARELNSTILEYRKGNSWNINLRTNIRDREMEELVSLLAALHNVAINSETLDQLNCGAKGDGKFSIIAAFKLLGPQNAIIVTGLGSLYGRSSCPQD